MTAALMTMQDLVMRRKARALGEKIRGEPDGITVAVELIQEAAYKQGIREQVEKVAVPA